MQFWLQLQNAPFLFSLINIEKETTCQALAPWILKSSDIFTGKNLTNKWKGSRRTHSYSRQVVESAGEVFDGVRPLLIYGLEYKCAVRQTQFVYYELVTGMRTELSDFLQKLIVEWMNLVAGQFMPEIYKMLRLIRLAPVDPSNWESRCITVKKTQSVIKSYQYLRTFMCKVTAPKNWISWL